MALWLLAACGPGGKLGSAGIDTSNLWTAEDGRFQVYRDLTADEYAAGTDTAGTLDEDDLLFTQYTTDGCDGAGWRVELRTGGVWASADPVGALLFSDAKGLSVCGWEAADGTVESYDPAVTLWTKGQSLSDGDAVTSGDWTVTAAREEDLVTYYGIFPHAVAFTLDGPGEVGGWALHFAASSGIVVMANDSFTADLVYTR